MFEVMTDERETSNKNKIYNRKYIAKYPILENTETRTSSSPIAEKKI